MWTSKAPTTVHVIGKCPRKGCKNRRRHTLPGAIVTDRFGIHTTFEVPASAPYETVSPRNFSPFRPASKIPTDHPYERAWVAAFRAHGWICDDHDTVMMLTPVKGTINLDKSCDGRCMNATGPNCECSCAGQNHGGAWG